jgi:GNAT superfamily N-acetyltransferase
VRFEVVCDLEEFKEYYKRNGFAGEQGTGQLGITEEKIVTQNPAHLIVMRENEEIIGHLIWHKSSTDEHRNNDPRDEEDKQILNKLAGGKENLVELHEVWLRQKYRGKGYGKQLFEFTEDFLRKRGYSSFVYYADHPAAIAICRKRGYKEAFMEKEKWYVFYHSLKKSH